MGMTGFDRSGPMNNAIQEVRSPLQTTAPFQMETNQIQWCRRSSSHEL